MGDEPTLEDRLEAIWGHLGNMTPDELRQHIVKIRSERRLIKTKRADKKKAVNKSDTAKTRMRKMLAGLSPEDAMKLLKGLND
jgi:hypothetical protein